MVSAGVGEFGEAHSVLLPADTADAAWAIESRVDDRVFRVVRDSTEFLLQDLLEDTVTRHPYLQLWSEMS